MNIANICKKEAICLIIVATINQVILGAPKTILLGNGSGSLLNIIAITAFALLLVIAISYLFKSFENSDIVDVSEFLGGKLLKNIISLAYILLFFVITVITLRYMTEFLKLIYFQNESIIFLTLFFLVAMAFSVQKGLKTIGKINIVFVILSCLTMLVLLIGSIPKFVPERIFPIFGNGLDNIFFANLSNVFAFGGLAYLMFLMPLLKNAKDFKQIGVISVIISSLYLFISVLCLLLVFSFMTITQDLFSVFLLTRIVEYAPILERTDAIYIFFWIFCVLSYLSINLFFIVKNFGKILNLKTPNAMTYCFCSIILGVTIIVSDVSEYYLIYDNFFVWAFSALIAISLLILILAKFKKRKNSRKE